ncbi:XMAP215 family protein [Cavenderia fasciculata]|uniref:XMAP215 family protein n=1 Tax=Cavenderia fasciculata TaxID=261658 RepID=F4Q7M6_CACFS|nr:XMAP215 family protein [Cavenderia fasciculata]EGG16408.1 XMAP215 family protein [Cavenderia fasciculata]|eukprot:XP_004354792.1 XMAP215 family protein [Cavenderia fasciculata]
MADDEKPSGPLEERLTHKNWKWKVSAYEELTQKFRSAEDSTGPLYNEYGPKFKTLLADSNPMSQEKVLDTLGAFIDRCDTVNKFAPQWVSVLVEKGFGSTRPKAKDKTIELLLATIEADSPEPVNESLLKGATSTSPKILIASIIGLRESLKTFGPKIVPIKPILKQCPPWFEHRDKNVRDEASALLVEIYRWMGKTISSWLESLSAIQMKALQEQFDKLPQEPAAPLKYMRSEAAKALAAAKAGGSAQKVEVEEIDPYTMLNSVDVLKKIDPEFWTGVEEKKWQIRSEHMENLQKILSSAEKIENADYSELVKVLKKTLVDTNLLIATKAITCIGLLAEGLRTGFTSHSKQFIAGLLNLYKEKKPLITKAISTSLDSIVARSLNFSETIEEVTVSMASKVPQTKQETLNFIYRSISTTRKPQDIQKVSKQLAKIFMEALNDTVESVRDSCAKAFGALGGIIGERSMAPYLNQLDPIKMKKIKDLMAASAPVITMAPTSVSISADEMGAGQKKPAAAGAVAAAPAPPKNEKLKEIISQEILDKLSSANLKDRVEGTDEIQNIIQSMGGDELGPYSPLIIQYLQEKPGWKDTNPQVSNNIISILTIIIKIDPNSSKLINLFFNNIIDKLIDIKSKDLVNNLLITASESISPQFVFSMIYGYAAGHKNPKITLDCLAWMTPMVEEFGVGSFLLKPLFDFIKSCLESTQSPVKLAAIKLIGILKLALGPSVIDYLSDVKKPLLDSIEKEVAKTKEQRVSPPTRTFKVSIDEIIPRTDISSKLNGPLLGNLGDLDWKMRQSALEDLERIVIDANRKIQPKLGSLVTLLSKGCLSDKNQKVVTTTLSLISLLAVATGATFDKSAKILLPGVVAILSDSKKPLRDAAINCMNHIIEGLGVIDPFMSSLAQPIVQDGAVSRKEALGWTVQHIGSLKSGQEAAHMVKPIVACLQDKNNDVRSMAETILSYIYIYIPPDLFKKEFRDIKPVILNTIQPIIEKYYKTKPPPPNSKKPEAIVQPVQPVQPVQKVQPTTSTTSTTSTTTTTNNRAPSSSSSASFIISNDKKSRQKDQQQMWYYQDPSEAVETLQDQVLSCFSEEFANMMFSANPQHSQQVVDMLIQLAEQDMMPLLSVVDVLFRWVTFKLFDMGLTSLKRSLKLLETILVRMQAVEYNMSDYEASCLIPILAEKSGTSNETFKGLLKQCYRLLSEVCPPQSQFRYTLEVIRSNNWRTRLESITECGQLINQHGGVCCGNLKITVPTIAKLLNDREPLIKQQVIQCFSQLYIHIGEEIWKYLSTLSQTDKNLLLQQFQSNQPNQPSQQSQSSPSISSTSFGSEEEEKFKEYLEELKSYRRENIDQTVELLKQISGVVSSAQPALAEKFLRFSEEYLMVLSQLLVSIFAQVFMDTSIFRLCKYLIHTIITIYSNEIIAKKSSVRSLETVLTESIRLLVAQPDSSPQQQADLEWITKALNQVLLRTLQNSNNTTLFCALLEMKTKVGSRPGQEKFNDLLVRCLLRATKSLKAPGAKVDELDISIILSKMNQFLIQQNLDETTKKTTKTLTSELLNIKGDEFAAFCRQAYQQHQQKFQPLFNLLIDLLGGIDNFKQLFKIQENQTTTTTKSITNQPTVQPIVQNISPPAISQQMKFEELGIQPLNTPEILQQQNYTIPVVNVASSVGKDGKSHMQTLMQNVNKEPRNFKCATVSEQKQVLSEIFKKVGHRDLTIDGLWDLYYFKKQFKDYDITPNLLQTTGTFQNYVTRHLQQIDKQQLEKQQEEEAELTSSDINHYSERLRDIQNTYLNNQMQPDSGSDGSGKHSTDQMSGENMGITTTGLNPRRLSQHEIKSTTVNALNTLHRIRGLSNAGNQPTNNTNNNNNNISPPTTNISPNTTSTSSTSSTSLGTQDLTSTVASLRQRLAFIKETSKSND